MPESTIHRAALPNSLRADELRLSPGEDGVAVEVDPERAGWRYLSYRARALDAGERVAVGGAGREAAVVVLGGGGVVVELDTGAATLELPGRPSVFEGMPWAAYVPPGRPAVVIGRPSEGQRVTVGIAEAPSASADAVRDPVRIAPDDIEIEVRGAGNATRQVNHIISPGFPAGRLLIVEVHTPGGNWSSWPPHKHDTDDMPGEAMLEEIYHYQLRRPEGWGIQRLYRRDGSRDASWAVRHGQVVLVTDGYHPFVAAHGYDAYYLNALAGDRRTMAASFDPDLAWTREAWRTMDPDPRVPLVR